MYSNVENYLMILIVCLSSFKPRGFFKGMWYPILSAGAMNSMFFGVYGTSLKLIEKSDALNHSGQYTKTFLAGCAGGAAQLVIACPVDLVKIKLQTQTGKNNISHATKA